MSLNFSSSPLALNSPYYIERPPLESLAYREIEQPGSLLRIKAPQKMGKSSLMIRILAHAQQQGYHSITIDFKEAALNLYSNLDLFLRWFCAQIAYQLNLPACLDDYWDLDLGSKVSTSIYLQTYILTTINQPIVIALNEIDLLFKYEKIAQDFLPLLRFWHEKSKQVELFGNLRFLVIYSTEVYINLNINQSPFNVGLCLDLPTFNEQQIEELALVYGLKWRNQQESRQLVKLLGGHPYLVNLTLNYLCQTPTTSLEEILTNALTREGIYAQYLDSHWAIIQENPQIHIAMQNLLNKKSSVHLSPLVAYQLQNMGLIKLAGESASFSAELYPLYYRKLVNLSQENAKDILINKLKIENKNLRDLVKEDSLTQVANRRYLEEYLQEEWRICLEKKQDLSLILLDIDYFKLYNDYYGHQQGDDCLKKVAKTLNSCLNNSLGLVARYGGEEFMIVLPVTNEFQALNLAEIIREKVAELGIEHCQAFGKLKIVTVSLGVTTTIPSLKNSPEFLIKTADQALYESKQKGRDRVTFMKFHQDI